MYFYDTDPDAVEDSEDFDIEDCCFIPEDDCGGEDSDEDPEDAMMRGIFGDNYQDEDYFDA